MAALRIASVTMDCRDPERMVAFWSTALGYVPSESASRDVAGVEDPNDRDVELVFVRVPEDKAVKNRVHLDIGANDREAEVERLVALGAERLDVLENWTVLRDPEGNEFCIIQAPEDDPIEGWRT